jgi:hypothetical protein
MAIQAYRFPWLPSFSRPISVRLTLNADGTGSIVARSVDRHAGLLTKVPPDTEKLVVDKTIDVDKAPVQDVLAQLKGVAFWAMPTEEEQTPLFGAARQNPTVRVAEADGSRWILEVIRDGEYHIVDKWSPKENSYSQLCRYLLRLGDVEAALY